MAPLRRRVGGLHAVYAAGVVLGMTLLGCQGRDGTKGAAADSAASAPAAGLRLAPEAPPGPLQADSIRELGRRLAYDSTHEATRDFGSGERRIRLRLQSQDSSYRQNQVELAAGRILGRIINLDSAGYARFGVAPYDTVYIWVDSVAAGWRGALVSSAPNSQPVVRGMRYNLHPDHPHTTPLARWVDAAGNEVGAEVAGSTATGGGVGPWIACIATGCCTLN